MIPYKPPKHGMTDPTNLYRWAQDSKIHLVFISSTENISFTKDDLLAMIKEIDECEKKNAAKVH